MPVGLRVDCEVAVPLSSGLGSSASAIVSGLLGANELLGQPASAATILALATEVEGHPDNVAAALDGGLVVVVNGEQGLLTERIEVRPVEVALAVSQIEYSTSAARAELPTYVALADAVYNMGRAALVVEALRRGDLELLGKAMDDRLHQAQRLEHMPGGMDAMAAARAAGAAAVAVSGSGPSLIAFPAPGAAVGDVAPQWSCARPRRRALAAVHAGHDRPWRVGAALARRRGHGTGSRARQLKRRGMANVVLLTYEFPRPWRRRTALRQVRPLPARIRLDTGGGDQLTRPRSPVRRIPARGCLRSHRGSPAAATRLHARRSRPRAGEARQGAGARSSRRGRRWHDGSAGSRQIRGDVGHAGIDASRASGLDGRRRRWAPAASRVGVSLGRAQRARAVVASGPPFSVTAAGTRAAGPGRAPRRRLARRVARQREVVSARPRRRRRWPRAAVLGRRRRRAGRHGCDRRRGRSSAPPTSGFFPTATMPPTSWCAGARRPGGRCGWSSWARSTERFRAVGPARGPGPPAPGHGPTSTCGSSSSAMSPKPSGRGRGRRRRRPGRLPRISAARRGVGAGRPGRRRRGPDRRRPRGQGVDDREALRAPGGGRSHARAGSGRR